LEVEVRFWRFIVAMQLELRIYFLCLDISCKSVITHNPTRINLFAPKFDTSHVDKNLLFYMHGFSLTIRTCSCVPQA
jgi:hypothetical protein